MASRREALVLVAVGAAAAAAGAYFAPGLYPDQDAAGVAELLAAQVRDLQGRQRRMQEWKGQVLICNFWATWCAPCREEIPALLRLRAKLSSKGVEIIGIAIDQVANVVQFVKELKIVYPVVIGDADSFEMMRRLGNSAGGLPFTVILDRDGRLAYRKLGQITEADLETRLASII